MNRSLMFVAAIAGLLVHRVSEAAEPIQIEIRETAGIERFHYPTTGELTLPAAVPAETPFRLLAGDRPVAAQWTPLDAESADGARRWAVDFGLDLRPNQTRKLVVEYGEGVSRPPAPGRGLKVERADGTIRVRHPSLEFVVPANLKGLLAAIRVSGDDWLAGKAPGLLLESRDGNRMPLELSDTAALRVTKSGPLAVALEAADTARLENENFRHLVGWRAKVDFPLGKSWVKVDLTLDDPSGPVRAVEANLRLRLQSDGKPPVLADVGAGDWTYAALRGTESLVYRTLGKPPNWTVNRVRDGHASVYATAPSEGSSPVPRGWAHLMDAERATAIAVDRFAVDTSDSIELAADGTVRIRREFFDSDALPENRKQLTFWLHVVASPPQWGAATSPQSMLAPPEVRAIPSER